MKRRNFILASGSTVLSGIVASRIQRPAIGLNFEISTPDKDPSKVDSLVIEFETLEITPKYIDEKEPVSIQAKVEVAGRVKKSNEVQASVVNGETKELEDGIDSIVIDGLNASSTISGEVTVSIDHSDVQDSYSRQFNITGEEIPDSVVHQYPISTFSTSTWNDNVGSANMSVNGLISSTFNNEVSSVFGDGVDDYGIADGPQNLMTKTSFGFAFTFQCENLNDGDQWLGTNTNANKSTIQVSSSDLFDTVGSVRLYIKDANNNTAVRGTDSNQFDDGEPHACVINKPDDDPHNWEIYVDDMSNEIGSVGRDQGLNSNNISTTELGFFARNEVEQMVNNIESHVGVFEFWESPLSQSERDGFISRRPEV
jgi:hypothetical protein